MHKSIEYWASDSTKWTITAESLNTLVPVKNAAGLAEWGPGFCSSPANVVLWRCSEDTRSTSAAAMSENILSTWKYFYLSTCRYFVAQVLRSNRQTERWHLKIFLPRGLTDIAAQEDQLQSPWKSIQMFKLFRKKFTKLCWSQYRDMRCGDMWDVSMFRVCSRYILMSAQSLWDPLQSGAGRCGEFDPIKILKHEKYLLHSINIRNTAAESLLATQQQWRQLGNWQQKHFSKQTVRSNVSFHALQQFHHRTDCPSISFLSSLNQID